MANGSHLNYQSMVDRALRGVLQEALRAAAEKGLPGEHHFFITFRTRHPEVEIPDALRERYPDDMTIVLQHQFWHLEIAADRFSVTLSFSGQPNHLVVPFEAVTTFADPSVRFMLQFEADAAPEAETAPEAASLPPEVASLPKPAPKAKKRVRKKASASKAEEAVAADPDKIVTLDRFRKK